MTGEYTIGETDFEYWARLWKVSASDPEVAGEEWVISWSAFRNT